VGSPAQEDGLSGYRNPALTVDGIVLSRIAGESGLEVLLIERGIEPFRGCHALPGGFVEYGEDIERAIHREISEETGLTGLEFRQFHTFGRPGRDPRGHTVSVVYIAEVTGPRPEVLGGDDAAAAAWFPVDGLPELAFDHSDILKRALASLPAP
jgi:8-oxo-dGTP diphosphatase